MLTTLLTVIVTISGGITAGILASVVDAMYGRTLARIVLVTTCVAFGLLAAAMY